MRINRLRSALKPGQDFSRTSRQKTCPYGHKESEDCHSASVPLRCTPSERQSSSRQQYPCLRPGYIKEQRSGDLSLLPPRISEILSSRSHKTPAVNAPDPTGENDDREQAVPRLKVSADRPKNNIIGTELCLQIKSEL